MPALIALVLAATGPTDYRALAAVRPRTVAARVRACGLGRVRVAYDAELQEDVIVVEAAATSDPRLRCAARASPASVHTVRFWGSIDRRYRRVYDAIQHPRLHADAIVWLAARGLLATVPPFDPARPASIETARAIERICGAAEGTVLRRHGDFFTFALDRLASYPPGDETLLCITNAAEAVGLRLGFIGNETSRTPK